jgi:hypothetical protein
VLTDLQIQRLKPEKGKTKCYADRDGLALEVRASGKKYLSLDFSGIRNLKQ